MPYYFENFIKLIFKLKPHLYYTTIMKSDNNLNQKTVFEKIIDNEIPSYKIYEDSKTIAILDILPINPGHTLVISKKATEKFNQLSETDYLSLMKTVKKIANKISQIYHPPRVGVIIEGFEIPHTHVHVFPAYSVDDFHKKTENRKQLSSEEMKLINNKLKLF